jgi:hypothetical protein
VSSPLGGPARIQRPTGQFIVVYFDLRNQSPQSASPSAWDVTLTDSQGRIYRSDFEPEQVQPYGGSEAFGNARVAPSSVVHLNMTFDVAIDADDLVLHVPGGNNDVRVGAPPSLTPVAVRSSAP